MRLHIVLRYVSFSLLLNALFMFISCIISGINNDIGFMPLFYSSIVTLLFGIFPIIFVPGTTSITNKEGLLIVTTSWLLSCLVGSLPYILYGGPFTFTNSWFESVSGFTTTGSSILSDIESLPLGLIFWRASTHWIGGIGIIIFVLSVMPFIGIAEVVLFKSEVSSMVRENFHHRARRAIQILISVYVGLTILETIMLLFFGMNFLDAISHSFATIATGGFSSKNDSIAHYNSLPIEITIIVFMILSGIHFGLLYSVVTGQWGNLWRSSIIRYYLVSMLVGIFIVTLNIHHSQYQDWWSSFRYAAFNIISVGTSTGFANTNTAIWPAVSCLLLIFFTLQCACAGSTSGGIKADRIVILFKSFFRQIRQLMYPKAILPLRINKETVKDELASKALLYISIYLMVIFIITFLLTILKIDMLSAFTGTIAAMGNVGPGLGSVGSTGNFNHIPEIGKWLLSITMLLGRLEVYALFIILTPNQWRKTVSY